MRVRARATSKLLAVAGDPVAHSLSPAMHNAAITALGLDAVYVAARTTPRAFPGLVYSLLEAGGGLNVTAPFKQQAAALVDHPTEMVKRTGACNTIWGSAEAPSGDNTDVAGVRGAARRLVGSTRVQRATIVGTGGAARAAAVALWEEWPGIAIEVVSRSADRLFRFCGWGIEAGMRVVPSVGPDSTHQLVINATPLGRGTDERLPLEWNAEQVKPSVLDLVYAPGETPWVRWAREQGLPALDGRVMLVEQGMVAFERFFGVPAPAEVMRAAVEDALRA